MSAVFPWGLRFPASSRRFGSDSEDAESSRGNAGHELQDKQKHLFDLRSQAVTEKLENPSQLKKTRREIAQLKTIQRERQLATQKTAAAAASTETKK